MVFLELIGGVALLALISAVALYFQISDSKIGWRMVRRARANAVAARQRADMYQAQRYQDPSYLPQGEQPGYGQPPPGYGQGPYPPRER